MTHTSQGHREWRGLKSLFSVLLVAVLAAPGFAKDPPARTYALASAPLEVFDRLPDLHMGQVPRLTEDERKLLAQVWEHRTKKKTDAGLKIDNALLLEAMLFASGVETVEARTKYRKQFDELVIKAREAVKEAKNDRERGDKLLCFLHAGVMNKGYEEGQTSFTAVFDTGKFNCVSSTAMYYIIGTRLGLELRALSIPGSQFQAGHASVDMIDGRQRIQVEPTNSDGFDWQAKINRPGVIVLGLVPDRKKSHEVDALGIAAMMYSNRGVALNKEKPPRQLEAVGCYLAALALGPVDESATNNLLAVFVNWGPQLAGEKKFEEAVRVLAFGVTVAPKAESLRNNQRFVWEKYIEATLEAGQDQDALTLIRRAAKEVQGGKDFSSESHWFSCFGDKQIDQNGWEAGLDVADRGLKVLPAAEGKKLLQWRSSVFRRWSQSLLDKQDAAGSLKVLARAYALDENDKEIIAGLAYHTQEVLRFLESQSGRPAMIEHYQELCQQFPKVNDIAEMGWTHARRAVHKLADDKKFVEAVAAVDHYRPLIAKPEQRAELGGLAYDHWARHLAREKKWEAALDKYKEGRKAFPAQERLTNNAIAAIDEWASAAIQAKNWDEAIRIYELGLKEYLPGNKHLQHNKEYCEKMKETNK